MVIRFKDMYAFKNSGLGGPGFFSARDFKKPTEEDPSAKVSVVQKVVLTQHSEFDVRFSDEVREDQFAVEFTDLVKVVEIN